MEAKQYLKIDYSSKFHEVRKTPWSCQQKKISNTESITEIILTAWTNSTKRKTNEHLSKSIN